MAKILLLGGTGAMGVYLVPELINLGHDVFVTSRSYRKSDNEKLTYIQGNAHDESFIVKVLADKYDAIVDFMVYSTAEFKKRHELLLSSTTHYIFVSSFGVFAASDKPITEVSPRLLDISTDLEFLATDCYPLTKARQEDILRASQYNNWTIVRPAITYSKTRFDLGLYGAGSFIIRALQNLPVILPQEILKLQTTMTHAGDVAKMISRLALNQSTFCEDYNVCTAEHRSWEEVAEYYKKLIGLTIVTIDFSTYLKVFGISEHNPRLQSQRIMDNSKVLKATGMQQENLMSLFDGLAKELANKNLLKAIKPNYGVNGAIDRITHTHISLKKATIKEKIIYYSYYLNIDIDMINKYIKKFIK